MADNQFPRNKIESKYAYNGENGTKNGRTIYPRRTRPGRLVLCHATHLFVTYPYATNSSIYATTASSTDPYYSISQL
jgi:hypothetical protein